MRSIQCVIMRSSNAAKRVCAFNLSRYERAFDVHLVLSGTVGIIFVLLQVTLIKCLPKLILSIMALLSQFTCIIACASFTIIDKITRKETAGRLKQCELYIIC